MRDCIIKIAAHKRRYKTLVHVLVTCVTEGSWGGLCVACATQGASVTHVTHGVAVLPMSHRSGLLAIVVLWLVTSTGPQQRPADHQQRPADHNRAPADHTSLLPDETICVCSKLAADAHNKLDLLV